MQTITREQFMQFFRSDDFHDNITPDDAQEIFATVLHGSSDITAERLNNLSSDYSAGVQAMPVEEYNALYNFIHRFIDMYDCECSEFMCLDDKGEWQKCLHCEAKNISKTLQA